MLHSGANGARTKVNVLKKVKVDGKWKLCPVVVEPNGKLKDRVQVNGRTEVHSEGVYYIEWRENSQRLRQSVPNRNHVLEQARLKALELDAGKAGIRAVEKSSPSSSPAATMIETSDSDLPSVEMSQISNAARVILRGVESYLQEIINASVRSQLAVLGIAPNGTAKESPLLLSDVTDQPTKGGEPNDSGVVPSSQVTQTLISEAIESYLKDVEPPQREQKTYDEYRLVLHKFRDTCGKRYLREINRDDCLGFMRHLYSMGNEARTVFNRMGIVQQLLKLHGITGLLKPRDKPKFVSNVREMYQPEELAALLKACSSDERVLYMFFLFTGERDKEVRYTTWSDIDFRRKCVRVTAKKHLGFVLPCCSSVTPCEHSVSADQLGDGISGEIAEYWELLFDLDTGMWKDDLQTEFEIDRTDLLIIDCIELQPELRGHGVGALAVERVIELLGIGCGVVACKPWPLQFTPAFATDPEKLCQLRPPATDLDTSVRKLRTYWSKLGFWPVGNSGIYAMSTSQRKGYPHT